MKVNIRRGATQIGGSAVEITANNGARIVLDIGIPLDAKENTPDLLPDIAGLRNKTDDLLGVLISHAHADHYGLGRWLDERIPIYMSDAAAKIIRAQRDHLKQKGRTDCFAFDKTQPLTDRKPVAIGPFKITPFAVDHAAYESFAFLVEADGKKLFYTGDFRAHGRMAGRTNKLMRNPPRDVDVMLMEGSSLERLNPNQHFETEADLEAKFAKIFTATPGLAMVHQSSQNIDRLVSVFRAARKTGRTLVLMPYTGLVLMRTGNKNLPNFTWDGVKKICKTPRKRHEISTSDIAHAPGKYVCIIGCNTSHLQSAGLLNPSSAYIYSMWAGYRKDFAEKTVNTMTEHNVQMHDVHTSGHADIPTLRTMVAAVSPRILVPIHTFKPEMFEKLFGDLATTQMHADNTEFEI